VALCATEEALAHETTAQEAAAAAGAALREAEAMGSPHEAAAAHQVAAAERAAALEQAAKAKRASEAAMAAMAALEADTSPSISRESSRGISRESSRGQDAGSRGQASTSSRGQAGTASTPGPAAATPTTAIASKMATLSSSTGNGQASGAPAPLHPSRQKKRPKSLMGRMLGMRSKELSLEGGGLVYSKGKGKKVVQLRYEAIAHVKKLPDGLGWLVETQHEPPQVYEFRASSQEERDMWVAAVNARRPDAEL